MVRCGGTRTFTLTDSVDISGLLKRASTNETKLRDLIDSYYDELDGSDEENPKRGLMERVRSAHSTEVLWEIRDRVELMRFDLHRQRLRLQRNLSAVSESYRTDVRKTMTTSSPQSAAYAEREAHYEMKNIDKYKLKVILERQVNELTDVLFFLDSQLKWIKDRQQWLRQEEQFSKFNTQRGS